MTKWEYHAAVVELFPSIDFSSQLDELGESGWELVTIVTEIDANGRPWHQAVFKRPAKESL